MVIVRIPPIIALTGRGNTHLKRDVAARVNCPGRRDHGATALKTIREIATLLVLAGLSFCSLGGQLVWNHVAGCAFTDVAAFFIFKRW